MRSLARYVVAHTVTRAMMSRLLSREDFAGLARTPSFTETWNALRKTSYGARLPEEERTEPLAVEKDLTEATAAQFMHLTRTLTGKSRDVARALLGRWELDALVFTLRLWHARDLSLARYIPRPPAAYGLRVDEILNADSLEAIAELFGRAPYAAPLRACARAYQDKRTLFEVELALEREYYTRLVALTRALGGSDAADGLHIVTAEIDLINLSWLARIAQYHETTLSQLGALMIPGPSQLSKRLIQNELTHEGLAEITAEFMGTRLQMESASAPVAERVGRIEVLAAEIAAETAHTAMAGFPFRITCVMAYYLLLRLELRNLCAVFAGKAAGLPEPEISAQLKGLR